MAAFSGRARFLKGPGMEASTTPGGSIETSPCPRCRGLCKAVPARTLRCLLRSRPAREVRESEAYFFCDAVECPAVYHGGGATFFRQDLRVAVFQKDPDGGVPACYCLGFTRRQVLEEAAGALRGQIYHAISGRIRAGGCDCEAHNPQGHHCLAAVMELMHRHDPDPRKAGRVPEGKGRGGAA